MLTGDAPLTALSVAREVEMTKHPRDMALILSEKSGSDGVIQWVPALAECKLTAIGYDPAEVAELAKGHDLIVTGRGLELALQREDADKLRSNLHLFNVF